MDGQKMREVDTETPVVWPAWCYSGDASVDITEDSATPHTSVASVGVNALHQIHHHHQQAAVVSAAATAAASSNTILCNKGKRKTPTLHGVHDEHCDHHSLHSNNDKQISSRLDKIISEQMRSIAEGKSTFCDTSSGLDLLYGKDAVDNGNISDPTNICGILNFTKSNDSCAPEPDVRIDNNFDVASSERQFINNNNDITSPVGSIKNERTSPIMQHLASAGPQIVLNGTQTQLSVTSHTNRSQSVTPISYSDTPQHQRHDTINIFSHQLRNVVPNKHLHGQLQQMSQYQIVQDAQLKTSKTPDFQPRNYSDFIRSLAAKYNNANLNESIVGKSVHLDQHPTGNNGSISTTTLLTSPTPKHITKETPSTPECISISNSPPQVPISSMFSGIHFSPNVLSPMIDMSSTQALLTLVRAAKEANIKNLLKVTTVSCFKRSRHLNAGQSLLNQRATLLDYALPVSPPLSNQSSNDQLKFHLKTHYQKHDKTTSPLLSASIHNDATRSSELSLPERTIVPANTSASLVNLTISLPSSNVTAGPYPLDLSSIGGKRLKMESPSPSRQSTASPQIVVSTTMTTSSTPNAAVTATTTTMSDRKTHGVLCHVQSNEINAWSVAQVCDFVGSIDICAEYKEVFREQQIDGSGLPLLTEDHLMNSLNMKLGPALKLRSVLSKRLGGPCPCVTCSIGHHHSIIQQIDGKMDSSSN